MVKVACLRRVAADEALVDRRIGRMRLAAGGAVVALVAALAVTGCGHAADDDGKGSEPYAAEFDEALKTATDPVVRAALADHAITDEELEQAKTVALGCFKNRGMAASYDSTGALTAPHPDGWTQQQVDDLVDECAGRSFDLLYSLKERMDSNPQNIPRGQAVLDCYKRFGLVDASMTTEQFWALDRSNPPWRIEDGDSWGCLEDPIFYHGGRPDMDPETIGSMDKTIDMNGP